VAAVLVLLLGALEADAVWGEVDVLEDVAGVEGGVVAGADADAGA
jgi:hypothetical protein